MNVLPTPRLVWLSLAATILTLVLVGCASVSGPSDPPVPSAIVVPTATPLPRGGNLTVGMAADVPDLRPWQPRSRAEEQISGLLYNGLMRLDDKLRPQPDLAESFAASADGRVLTFTLRSGLTWHDGAPLEAADVQFTLERMRGLPFTSTALLADLRYISAVATPTTSTVVLSLTERYAPLLSHLTLPILPRHLLTDRDIGNTNFWDVPVGSGPFQFEQRQPGQSVVLARFENFHRGAPLLDRVAFALADTPEASIEALRDGRLQLAEVPWSASRSISGTLPNLQVGSYPENGYYFLGFNMREGSPFADVRVRQALARAVDLPRLVEGVTQGQGLPIGSSAVAGSWADFTPPPGAGSNTDEARALLDAAGWPLPEGATIRARDGVTLTARLFVRSDDERRVAAAQRIAEAAASIGMQIAVEPADFDSVIISKYVPPYDFELLLGSWSNGAGDPEFGDYAYYDPDDFALFHSSQINQGLADTRVTRNFVGFSDSAYDNQAQAARQLYDLEARSAAIRQTQARIAELRPYLFLWADRLPVALSTSITTLDGPVNLNTPMYFWNIDRWHLK